MNYIIAVGGTDLKYLIGLNPHDSNNATAFLQGQRESFPL